MDSFFQYTGSWIGLIGSVGLTLASYFTNKFIKPFLKVGKRQKYAELIARLADDITDDLVERYPNKTWVQHIDDAVDSLISTLGISLTVARRAIQAAVARKKRTISIAQKNR